MNPSRLLRTFLDMVAIDSPSGQEADMARFASDRLRSLGLEPRIDGAGNVLASLSGRGPRLLLCAHMDNVPPCRGVKTVVDGDWIRSDGTTILGADDKSGIAVILEALEVLKEQGIDHLPVEVAFTVKEEVGLAGAQELDTDKLGASWGLVLDHVGAMGNVVVRAPSLDFLEVTVRGRAAHAGVAPEKGINAIQAAAHAIAAMPLGRLDPETTANVGTIQGGVARNIVPEEVRLLAEARSHDPAKLAAQTDLMVRAFREKTAALGAVAKVEVTRAYTGFALAPEAPIVCRVLEAGRAIGLPLQLASTGGGSDANIFNARGIPTANMSTGYQDAHSTSEALNIPALGRSAEFLIQFLKAGP